MTCDDYLNLIYEQVDGEISITNATVLDSHLKECSKCMRVYESICQADTLFKKLVPTLAPDTSNIASRLYEESLQPQLGWSRFIAATVAGWIAATVAFIAAGSTLWLPVVPIDLAPEHLLSTMQAIDMAAVSNLLKSALQSPLALSEIDLAATVVAAAVLLQIVGSYILTRSEHKA